MMLVTKATESHMNIQCHDNGMMIVQSDTKTIRQCAKQAHTQLLWCVRECVYLCVYVCRGGSGGESSDWLTASCSSRVVVR